MKKRMTALLTVLAALMVTALASCGKVPDNTVFSADDLSGKKVGVQQGTTGDTLISDQAEEDDTINVVRYSKGADAVTALKQGKVDAVIIDSEPAGVFVSKNKDLKVLDEAYADEEQYAIAIKKDNGDLKDKINAALKTLEENGTLDKIRSNYQGDTAGGYTYTSPADVSRANGTLNMATNATFPPYEYYESSKIVGLDVDMAQAIADILGMELKVNDMEFDSIVPAIQSGKADIGVAGMTVTEDRLKNVDFSDSYATSKQVIIVRAK